MILVNMINGARIGKIVRDYHGWLCVIVSVHRLDTNDPIVSARRLHKIFGKAPFVYYYDELEEVKALADLASFLR